MQKFEYRILEMPSGITSKKLDEQGEDGWELIAIIPNVNAEDNYDNFLYYFKRQK